MKSTNSVESPAPQRGRKRLVPFLIAVPLLALVVFEARSFYVRHFPRILNGHSGSVTALSFSPDGQSLISVGDGDSSSSQGAEIRLWNWHSGRLLKQLNGGLPIDSVAFLPDGKTLVCTRYKADSGVVGRPIPSYTALPVKTKQAAKRAVSGMVPTPPANLSEEGNGVEVWKIIKGSLSRFQTYPQKFVLDGANSVSPDGKMRVNVGDASGYSAIKAYNISTGRALWSQDFQKFTMSHELSNPVFVSNGMIAVGLKDNGVALLLARDGRMQRMLKDSNNWGEIVAASPDGHCVASGGKSGDINLWDIQAGKRLHFLRGHTGQLRTLAFSPDGKTLASSGQDFTILLWDVVSGKVKRTWQDLMTDQMTFSPDGKTLAIIPIERVFSTGTVQLWDISRDVS